KVLKEPSIPNAFSPNGDGINDTWIIKYLESYPGATVDVFNRYGQSVFHSEGYSMNWDGTFKGQALPIGTYYYIVDPKNGRKKMQGSVTIIR
ncbi:gliding motility-associated C-terminal domain-containing protein, partial [Acinetobacter baumannii]